MKNEEHTQLMYKLLFFKYIYIFLIPAGIGLFVHNRVYVGYMEQWSYWEVT